MPNTTRPPALSDAQNQQPQASTDAPRQGPLTRSLSRRAALGPDRLAVDTTSWPVVTPQQRFVTAPQTPAAPLAHDELTIGVVVFDDANLGRQAVRRGLGAGLQPPRSISAYVANLQDMSAELAACLPSRGSPRLAILEALENVPRWYAQLPANGVIALTFAQAQTHRCLISQEPFDNLEHPVGVHTGDVLHVFEGADLLIWMKHQTEPRTDERAFAERVATHPLTRQPLHLASLQRVQVQAFRDSAADPYQPGARQQADEPRRRLRR